jgi:hypothetical protein
MDMKGSPDRKSQAPHRPLFCPTGQAAILLQTTSTTILPGITPMSAMGQKRKSEPTRVMSGLLSDMKSCGSRKSLRSVRTAALVLEPALGLTLAAPKLIPRVMA